jgi:mono/diheme cytochrome c family protein
MRKFLFGSLIICMFVLTACGSGAGGTEANATLEPVPAEFAGQTNPLGPDAAADGAKVFQANCVPCHGPEGHGDGPAGQSLEPKPKNLGVIQNIAGDDYLFWRISRGSPGTSMVAWDGILTDDQIWQVIAFIRTLTP